MDKRIERLAGVILRYRQVMSEMGIEVDALVLPERWQFEQIIRIARRDIFSDLPETRRVKIDRVHYDEFSVNGLRVRCPIEISVNVNAETEEYRKAIQNAMSQIISPKFTAEEMRVLMGEDRLELGALLKKKDGG